MIFPSSLPLAGKIQQQNVFVAMRSRTFLNDSHACVQWTSELNCLSLNLSLHPSLLSIFLDCAICTVYFCSLLSSMCISSQGHKLNKITTHAINCKMCTNKYHMWHDVSFQKSTHILPDLDMIFEFW